MIKDKAWKKKTLKEKWKKYKVLKKVPNYLESFYLSVTIIDVAIARVLCLKAPSTGSFI